MIYLCFLYLCWSELWGSHNVELISLSLSWYLLGAEVSWFGLQEQKRLSRFPFRPRLGIREDHSHHKSTHQTKYSAIISNPATSCAIANYKLYENFPTPIADNRNFLCFFGPKRKLIIQFFALHCSPNDGSRKKLCFFQQNMKATWREHQKLT